MYKEVENVCWFLTSSFRLLLLIIIQIYTVTTYFAWMLLFLPLRFIRPIVYWRIEHQLHRWLLATIVQWIWAINQKVVVTGDDITHCLMERTLVLINHQTTADVPFLIYSFFPYGKSLGRSMWIVDSLFRWTTFGLVCWFRGDFFISQGKNVRKDQLRHLRQHLLHNYSHRDQKWLLLFPEGGFLYKRRESSQSYAKKNGYPILNHVTLPRLGAFQTTLNTFGPNSKLSDQLKWILDVTIVYPKNNPVDFSTAFTLQPASCVIYVHYRLYSSDDVPVADEEKMRTWLFEKWSEKDKLIDEYYRTGTFPAGRSNHSLPDSTRNVNVWAILSIHGFFITCAILLAYLWSIVVQGSRTVVLQNW